MAETLTQCVAKLDQFVIYLALLRQPPSAQYGLFALLLKFGGEAPHEVD